MYHSFLADCRKRFQYYKSLGDKTFAQLPSQEGLFWEPSAGANSMAIIVQHLYGNMLSRWTDFLTTDGEKTWRERDAEFEPLEKDPGMILDKWEKGWACLFAALDGLTPAHLGQTIYIRSEPLTVADAILRQLAHYPYHVGQIVYLGKCLAGQDWASLSIPKGQSAQYLQKVQAEQEKRPTGPKSGTT